MRILIIISFLILTVVNIPFAQNNSFDKRFEKVDQHVTEVSRKFIFHPQLLVEKLCENMNNDYDKVRAIYVWVATNTEYDLLAYYLNRYDGQGINEVLASGKALCSGFSLLFEYLCKKADIEAVVIEGYAKGLGYRKNQQFKRTNHAWNAVFIHGSWYLLDVTWAAGDPNEISKRHKGKDFNSYFLTTPTKFIQTHLPEDPSWQLIENKISLAEFEKSNLEYSSSEDHYFDHYSPQDYLGLNEFEKDVKRYKRAANFNPRDYMHKERLSFAYLYRGISLTEDIRNMDYNYLVDSAKVFCEDFYSYLDSACITIEPLDNWKIPKTKRILPDEMNYQKGVFNYEMGKELFVKTMEANLPMNPVDEKIEVFFKVAEEHFENVPTTSIYLKDAHEYLSYISDFRIQRHAYLLSAN